MDRAKQGDLKFDLRLDPSPAFETYLHLLSFSIGVSYAHKDLNHFAPMLHRP